MHRNKSPLQLAPRNTSQAACHWCAFLDQNEVCMRKKWCVTVDGWNPANQLRLVVYPMPSMPLLVGFHIFQVVVWDFSHQQYHLYLMIWWFSTSASSKEKMPQLFVDGFSIISYKETTSENFTFPTWSQPAEALACRDGGRVSDATGIELCRLHVAQKPHRGEAVHPAYLLYHRGYSTYLGIIRSQS